VSDPARAVVEDGKIVVACSQRRTERPIERTRDLYVQVAAALAAHERICGRCDTTAAWARIGVLDAPVAGEELAGGQRTCARCGAPFAPLTRFAKYCTTLCRQRASRARRDERERERRR
jgi:hypothetical protein